MPLDTGLRLVVCEPQVYRSCIFNTELSLTYKPVSGLLDYLPPEYKQGLDGVKMATRKRNGECFFFVANESKHAWLSKYT